MKVVKAAAVQLSPVLYSREGTVDKIVRKIHELGQQGVQFATFPETVVPYYPYFSLWSGAKATARVCAPSTAWWGALASWRAGSITTRWRATR